jgi:hypothetical protein
LFLLSFWIHHFSFEELPELCVIEGCAMEGRFGYPKQNKSVGLMCEFHAEQGMVNLTVLASEGTNICLAISIPFAIQFLSFWFAISDESNDGLLSCALCAAFIDQHQEHVECQCGMLAHTGCCKPAPLNGYWLCPHCCDKGWTTSKLKVCCWLVQIDSLVPIFML